VISKVVVLVVQQFEFDPLISHFRLNLNKQYSDKMCGLGKVYFTQQNSIEVYFLKSNSSAVFDCDHSGYSHVAALAAIAICQIQPDILINFSVC
jgi:hypothetical protein